MLTFTLDHPGYIDRAHVQSLLDAERADPARRSDIAELDALLSIPFEQRTPQQHARLPKVRAGARCSNLRCEYFLFLLHPNVFTSPVLTPLEFPYICGFVYQIETAAAEHAAQAAATPNYTDDSIGALAAVYVAIQRVHDLAQAVGLPALLLKDLDLHLNRGGCLLSSLGDDINERRFNAALASAGLDMDAE